MGFLFFKLKLKWIAILSIFLSCYAYAHQNDRESSWPFLSGDTFRKFADHLFDETSTSFKPRKVKYGDVIFVKGDMLGEFFEIKHPFIENPYVLLCHNSDERMPGGFGNFLDDPKILAWFAQNIEEYSHPKLINLPIGLANRRWGHGSIELIEKVGSIISEISREHLLYLNISVSTFPKERQYVYDLFKENPFCFDAGAKPFEEYLRDLASCKFVVSPRGNGIDCHRTWEALYLGAIPIVRTSSLDPMYEGLPVLIVNEWSDISGEFLEKIWEEMRGKEFNFAKLYASFWYKKITQFKKCL